MVVVEFPAEWDEGVGDHGVYCEESYDEGDVDDTYEQDEQEEAGDGMDDAFDQNENENENQDHEEAQDDPDEFEEITEEIEAETDRDEHGWDSANYESSRNRKRNRAGQKWGWWHRKRQRWSEHAHKEHTDKESQTQKWGAWHQRERWSEHTNKEHTDDQEQPSVQWFFHAKNAHYRIKMPEAGEPASQSAPKVQVQKFEARHSPPAQVVHPWHSEVASSEPEQREQRIWPAGLASSLKKGGKGSKTKGGKGKSKDTKGFDKGWKGSKGEGKTKDAPGKGKRPVLQPEPLLPDTARGLPRALLAGPPAGNSATGAQLHVPARQAGPTRPKLVGPPTGPPGNSATGAQLHVPARQAGPRTVPARPEGAKRPLGVGASHQGAKGFKAEPQAPSPQLKEQRKAQPKSVTMKVVLKPVVAEKLQQLNSRGVKLTPEALRGLASADAKDAEVLMQALLGRGEVPNPSNFITASLANLAKKQATEAAPIEQSQSVQHQPAARAAPASAGISAARKVLPRGKGAGPKGSKGPKGPKGSRSRGTDAGAAIAPPAPVAPVAPVARVPGLGQPPRRRTTDLPFERLAVQAKLFALNKQGIWAKQGKALDESALSALMQIEPARGLEILDEVESRGVGLVDPSRYARDLAADEEKVYPPS